MKNLGESWAAFSYRRDYNVIGRQGSSWREEVCGVTSCVCVEMLDDVLKELHGSHNVLILRRKKKHLQNKTPISLRCLRRLRRLRRLGEFHEDYLYLLTSFYEFLHCHHAVSIAIHLLCITCRRENSDLE